MDSNFNPLISIIINCYEGEKYLEKSLESIKNQTYQNWEVIFWDVNTSDQCFKIFNKSQEKRFKYFNEGKKKIYITLEMKLLKKIVVKYYRF